MSAYYLSGWWRGERTDLLVMYRPAGGDSDYYPLARQFGEGRIGEGFTAGKIGKGWIGFPGASVVLHGIALRLFGPVGFALADLLTPCVYFLCGARFLMSAGSAPLPAMLLALFGALRCFSALGDALIGLFGYSLHGVPYYIKFLQSWELRFPRNFVSEIFVLGALASWIEFARHGIPRRRSWWLGTAVWLALVLQSDIYSFAALGLAFAAVVCVEFRARSWRFDHNLATAAALATGVFLVLVVPFLLQRWYLSPEVLERFGVFKLARSHAVALADRAWHYLPTAFVWGTLALPWVCCAVFRSASNRSASSIRTAVALTVLQLAGYAAMPAFVGLSGQAVQLYHFREAAHTLVAWSALAATGIALTSLRSFALVQRAADLPAFKLAGATAAAASIVALLGVLWSEAQVRHEAPGPARSVGTAPPAWAQTYHADWTALAVELDHPRYASARILATADGELYSWWTGLRNRQSFLAQAFVTALPDSDLLQRLGQFARLNRVEGDRFLPWVTTVTYTKPFSHWFACARYGANALHTYSTLDDYTPDQRREIANLTDPLDCWHLIIPQSGLRRLQRAFDEADTTSGMPTGHPDLMILTGEFPELSPDPRFFSLAYENRTFRVFCAKPDSPAAF
jgi:hypothetical protein